MKKIIREICDFYRFFWRTPREQKYIVFYSEHRGYYPYFEGIIRELTKVHNMHLCYISSDFEDPIFRREDSRISTYYLNKLLPYFMIFVDSKLVIMTMTDLHQFHIKRSVRSVHYVYVFHALVSTHVQYREGAFDYYDTILCAGPHHIKEIRNREQQKKLARKNLVQAGYYPIERIFVSLSLSKSILKEKTILVAPSWGKGNILETCGHKLIEKLLQLGYDVILRPHPEALRRAPELVHSFKEKFGENKGFILEGLERGDESILKADLLITGWSGIALEYAFGTERPVLFLDVPRKIQNEKFEELQIEPFETAMRSEIGLVASIDEIDIIEKSIEYLFEKRNEYASRIRTIRPQAVYAFGRSSKVSAQSIVDLL